ncbi:conserved exported hypothetical protein [Mesorhizobium metallidurans STM 2683]|uniref:Uncharacterized protein n=1 Tax=Mesorhizobium metallidurans STM 2683 TaxID=1297569 RepID=M5EL01_9HYPH|nr:hypothetical protein [Mesorhizobium metallidurans]CCV05012.1 conserved exported hypothetical protein [Mesorhizobium metallidurans STM 2683]
MNTKFAASVLSALLYAQGLLGFAGLVTVLLKDRAQATEFAIASEMGSGKTRTSEIPSGPSLLVVR